MLALKEYVYNKLISDSSVQSLLGSSFKDRIHYQYAPDNQKVPYIVHYYITYGRDIAVASGYWDIHIWDAGSNPARVDALRDRIVAIFGRQYSSSIPGYKAVRFWYEGEQMVAEPAADPKDARIWRHILRFNFRASSAKDICGIIAEHDTGG